MATIVKELEDLRDKVERLIPRAMAAGQHDAGKKLIEIHEKLQQRIDGHKAQRKRKK